MKNHHGLTSALLTLSAITCACQASAGAWVGAKGTGYTKLGYATYHSTTYLGNNPSFKEFDSTNTSLYAEYGLGRSFALYGSLLHQSYDQDDAIIGKSHASGFSDTELGLRYQWQAEPFVLSTSLLIKTPFLYDKEDGLGNHQEDYEAKVLFGKSLNQYGYVGIELGYRLRSGAPSDEYRYLFEYGFSVNKNLYFRTKLDGILSANNSDPGSQISQNLSNPLASDSGKLELTTGWNFNQQGALKGYGIELTFTREIYGDNTLQGNSIQLGITKVY